MAHAIFDALECEEIFTFLYLDIEYGVKVSY
jgi:hypothetical protein